MPLRNYLRLIILLVALFSSCSDDDHFCPAISTGAFQEQFDAARGAEKYEVIKAFFQSITNDELLITSAQFIDENYWMIQAEDGSSLCIHEFFIRNEAFSLQRGLIHLNLSNGETTSAPYFEKWDSLFMDSISINPYGVNPLCAAWYIELPQTAILDLIIVGKYDNSSDVHWSTEIDSKQTEIPILGLYQNHKNKIVASFKSPFGSIYFQDTLTIETNTVMTQTALIEILAKSPEKMKAGMNVVSSRSHPSFDVPYMFDNHGELRWLLDFTDIPVLNRLYYDVGIERLQNGNWYCGDIRSDKIYEFGLLGNVANSWDLGSYQFHHKVQEKSNGNFLVSVSDPNSRHLNGRRTNQDFIIEIDRTSGEIINTWDLKESLDEYRTTMINNLSNSLVDWMHVNAIYSDDSDGSIILSGRHQGVVKLSSQNEVIWILAPHHGWTVNRRGEQLDQYLLTPLDDVGNIISDSLILYGYENHPMFEWCWGQHATSKIANGNLILFDNGDRRNHWTGGQYSRIVEYKIDETAMTIQQVWTYGKELGSANYSRLVSNVEYDDETQNFFMNNGLAIANSTGNGGRAREINRHTKEVVFHASITPPNVGFTFHRLHRRPLYPD